MEKIIDLHRFFVKQSKTYAAPFTFKTYCYYPIAYVRFMWYSIGDVIRANKYQRHGS